MKSYLLKINVLIFAVFLFLPVLVFAANIKVNGKITVLEGSSSTGFTKAEAQYLTKGGSVRTADITTLLNRTIYTDPPKVGGPITFTVDGSTVNEQTGTVTAVSINKLGAWDDTASLGESSTNAPKSGYYSELFHKYIPGGSILKTWVNDLVMPWALGIIGTIAVVTVMVAGIMYMTSA
ncbi:hypothetical protein COY62_02780, partial [bacterium (Candidatus Howlettbacteria) CG_4_10_14_0_8_um_filter_40_9]